MLYYFFSLTTDMNRISNPQVPAAQESHLDKFSFGVRVHY